MQPVSMDDCPACKHANPPAARYCSDCGTALVMRCPACATVNTRTRQHCHHCHTALHAEHTEPAALQPPAADDAPVVPLLYPDDEQPPAADWRLDLRADAVSRWPELPTLSAALDEAPLVADPDAPQPPAADPPPQAVPAPEPAGARPSPSADELATAKVKRRAAVRRSQQRRRPMPLIPPLLDVLVLEADPAMRATLCTLLEAFGYRPHVAVSVAEAEGLSLRRLYAAAFLCLADDTTRAAELCRRLHDAPRGRPSALIAVIDRDRHADRVRMQLAGADQTIFRPVARGDVARALDACALTLPHDPRQGSRPND
jgi:CheY-like chemotaxis protein